MTDYLDEAARRTRVHATTEVLVVGGRTAGTAAAIAAARAGAQTMLVERYGTLGGIATGGLVILLLTLDDGAGRQMVRGLCQEITDRLAARGAALFPLAGEWGSDDPALVEHYRRWGLVWDLGCHKGFFARLAGRYARHVVALDRDPAAVEHLYRSLKAERRGKTLSKKELKAFKDKRREKKEEKRRAWGIRR